MTIRTMLALGALLAAYPACAEQSCESLASMHLPGIAITSAASVPAGSLPLPSGPRGGTTVQAPAFCRVAATVGREVRMELWMPQQWNHKLLGWETVVWRDPSALWRW
jgi:feruloyl esterase